MAIYRVNFEIADDGRCFAHVPELPGCTARAESREAVENELPGAIRKYHVWLQGHGETVPGEDEPLRYEVEAEIHGVGAFDPGDATALFGPDREPLTTAELETRILLTGYARSDLLGLVERLPGAVLDWEAPFLYEALGEDPRFASIRGLLRHVGNAEKSYVSRIVGREALPPEWSGDEDLPILEFLEMVRRTAVRRLLRLDAGEREAVVRPGYWTDRPDEAWTARKVLRRFLEHELEHTSQISDRLALYRAWLYARLVSERAGLMESLLGMDETTLCETPVLERWTARDILAHVAAWDRWEHRSMLAMISGDDPDLSGTRDIDALNETMLEPWRDASLHQVVTEFVDARQDWRYLLDSMTDVQLCRARSVHGREWSFALNHLPEQWRHDRKHAREIAAWRAAMAPEVPGGPQGLARAALDAARMELLTAASLVPAAARNRHQVCGHWTTQELLGHIADWEWIGAEVLAGIAQGHSVPVAPIEDFDAWNEDRVQARRSETWEQVVDDLAAARGAMVTAYTGLKEKQLEAQVSLPWGGRGTASDVFEGFFYHDREHAGDLGPRETTRA